MVDQADNFCTWIRTIFYVRFFKELRTFGPMNFNINDPIFVLQLLLRARLALEELRVP